MAKYHTSKEISNAIEFAIANGWSVVENTGKNHIKCELYCHESSRDGCIYRVSCTPKVPEAEAKRIIRAVNKCPHQ